MSAALALAAASAWLAGGLVACADEHSDRADPALAPVGSGPEVLSIPGRACPDQSPLTYQSFGAPFLMSYCTGCHASGLDASQRQGAPVGVDLDSLAAVRALGRRVYERAADQHTTMPPVGGPTAEQRALLGDWLACGAPGDELRWTAKPSPPKAPLPARCDGRPMPLPASLTPRCSAETWACVTRCATLDFGCPERCVAADTTPADPVYGVDCGSCVGYQQYECTDRTGCHSVVAELACCRQDKCATSADPACTTRECPQESYAYGYCLGTVTPECSSLASGPARQCFPPGDAMADASVDDGGDGEAP